jgi:hypothetical protein
MLRVTLNSIDVQDGFLHRRIQGVYGKTFRNVKVLSSEITYFSLFFMLKDIKPDTGLGVSSSPPQSIYSLREKLKHSGFESP